MAGSYSILDTEVKRVPLDSALVRAVSLPLTRGTFPLALLLGAVIEQQVMTSFA